MADDPTLIRDALAYGEDLAANSEAEAALKRLVREHDDTERARKAERAGRKQAERERDEAREALREIASLPDPDDPDSIAPDARDLARAAFAVPVAPEGEAQAWADKILDHGTEPPRVAPEGEAG